MKRNLLIVFGFLIIIFVSYMFLSIYLNSDKGEDNMFFKSNINVNIDGIDYTVTLEDNETSRKFYSKLNQEFVMSDLNNNEKYVYMKYSLPNNASSVNHINAGDIMLYNSNCLVIFYKSFDTEYSYTRIGHINNLEELDSFDVRVAFSK